MSSSASRNRRRWFVFLLVQILAAVLITGAFILRQHIDAYPGHTASGGKFSGCVFHDFLHLYCPLCGGTRGIVALFRGQPLTSLRCNPLSAYLAVGFLCQDLRVLIGICRKRDRLPVLPTWYWWGLLGLGLAFFFVRNILLLGFGIDPLGDLLPFYRQD